MTSSDCCLLEGKKGRNYPEQYSKAKIYVSFWKRNLYFHTNTCYFCIIGVEIKGIGLEITLAF